MDNKAYLDQIAVKGKKPSVIKSLLTPAIIKLLAAGLVALILFFVVIGILNSNNAKITQKFEAVYQRAASLALDDNPLYLYNQKLKSSDLRQYNSTLQMVLATFNNSYRALAPTAGFDPEAISSSVVAEDETNTATIEAELNAGYLNGMLDHTYAATAYYQISILITMNQEAIAASTNTDLSDVLNKFNNGLIDLQKLYKKYMNSN
jgi:hypothetical protein